MFCDIDRVLIPADKIAQRVRELARQITLDHTEPNLPADSQITIVPILTGAMIFSADLIREMPVRMKIGLLSVSSYPGTSTNSQGPTLGENRLGEIRGRHVLLVDDILDSGETIKMIVPLLRDLGAATVKTCVLLRKDRPSAREVQADYVGFDIPDEFVVGYGLDYDNYYRNLPEIVTLKREIIDRTGNALSTSTV
jgi:hypoxanthine phosphoribosyltransferase